jgi:predicted alpha/beta hydrolase
MISPDLQSIATENGQAISASFFRPESDARAAVLIVPAMGTVQQYYAPLAAWLASRGFLVATFDYSGTGLSRNGDLRELKVDIVDWAQDECHAMVNAISAEVSGKPLYWLGHSLGGQIFGFVPNRQRVTKAVTIASGSGYWLENSPALKWKVWWLWYVVAPLSMRLLGYFPGKRLRMVGDLPRGVMEQWRRWCLDPDYAVGVEGAETRSQFAALRTPITSFSFSDDEFMSARNIDSLHGFYASAPRTTKRFSPADIGVKRIGHFGFFNARFEQSLWQAHLLPELTTLRLPGT